MTDTPKTDAQKWINAYPEYHEMKLREFAPDTLTALRRIGEAAHLNILDKIQDNAISASMRTHGGSRNGAGRPTGTKKKARIVKIVTVQCSCPVCGSENVTQGGSFMICPEECGEINCSDCGAKLELPKRVFL